MRRTRSLASAQHAPYMSHMFNLSRAQNLKPHDHESNNSNYDSEFDAFSEELGGNWCDLIEHD